MVHIGQKIQELVYELNIPISEFASRINKSRTVAYDIFTRETIDTGLLYKISEVLEYNFFKLYFENEGPMANDASEKYAKSSQQEISQQLISYKKELDNAIEEINKLKKAMKPQSYKTAKKSNKKGS